METKKYAVPEGCKITSVDFQSGVIIYECATPEHPKFKRGDFVVINDWIAIWRDGFIDKTKSVVDIFCNLTGNKMSNSLNVDMRMLLTKTANIRLATPEEKQLLLDKMHEQGRDWNGEKVIDWVWKPKMGEPYWCIVFSPLRAERVEWCNDSIDNERLKDNRIFATEALAQQAFTELQTVLKQAKKY